MTPKNKLSETQATARRIAFEYTRYLSSKQVFALEAEILNAIEMEREACAVVADDLEGHDTEGSIAIAIRARAGLPDDPSN